MPMNSAACAENIPRSEDKDSFAAQSIRVSDSKAGAVNYHPFLYTSHLCSCILSSEHSQLSRRSLIHPWAGLFAWGSQWCSLMAMTVDLLSRVTQRRVEMKTKPSDTPASLNQQRVLPLHHGPVLAHLETLPPNPPPEGEPVSASSVDPYSFLLSHSFLGCMTGDLAQKPRVFAAAQQLLRWETGVERGCTHPPCYKPTTCANAASCYSRPHSEIQFPIVYNFVQLRLLGITPDSDCL